VVVPSLPWVEIGLHAGLLTLPSQINAYHVFDSASDEYVVVAAVATVPETVAAETAQRLILPPGQVGAAPEFPVAVVEAFLQIRR
jgi:hypothetical protein